MASPSFNDDLVSNLNPQFAGLFQRVSPDNEEDVPSAAEVVDDYEGEQETIDLQNGTSDNHGDVAEANADDDDSDSEDDTDDEACVGLSGLENVVKNASKGVTEGTDGEYRRFEKSFLAGLPSDRWLLAKWRNALSSWLPISSSMVVSRSSVQHPM